MSNSFFWVVRARFRALAMYAGLAGLALAGTQGGAAQASDVWRFDATRGGGAAYSCDRFGRRDVCAVLFCRAGGGLQFGLDGLVEEDGRHARSGSIAAGRYFRPVRFSLERGPGRSGELWVADLRDTDRLVEQLKRASDAQILIEPRRNALDFTLVGSSRAISTLEARCDAAAERREDRREGRREGRRTILRYQREITGVWGDRPATCRSGGWVFTDSDLATPFGVQCERVLVAEGDNPDEIRIRGLECFGGRRAPREVELVALRDGPHLLLREAQSGARGYQRLYACR